MTTEYRINIWTDSGWECFAITINEFYARWIVTNLFKEGMRQTSVMVDIKERYDE